MNMAKWLSILLYTMHTIPASNDSINGVFAITIVGFAYLHMQTADFPFVASTGNKTSNPNTVGIIVVTRQAAFFQLDFNFFQLHHSSPLIIASASSRVTPMDVVRIRTACPSVISPLLRPFITVIRMDVWDPLSVFPTASSALGVSVPSSLPSSSGGVNLLKSSAACCFRISSTMSASPQMVSSFLVM